MKATSIIANKNAEVFKENHKQRILRALDSPMTAVNIGHKIGLSSVSVSRRMSELECDGLVIPLVVFNGLTVYKKVTQTQMFPVEKKKSKKDIEILELKKKITDNLKASVDTYSQDEVKSMIQMIYSEFTELPTQMKNTVSLRRIIEQEVEQRPIKPIKIFK